MRPSSRDDAGDLKAESSEPPSRLVDIMKVLQARMPLEAKSGDSLAGIGFWLVLYLCLNVVDVLLTNRAYAMLESAGLVGKMAEANPILQPLAGSWILVVKGFLALVVMVVANRFTKMPMRRMLIWACLALLIICIWNAKSIGLI